MYSFFIDPQVAHGKMCQSLVRSQAEGGSVKRFLVGCLMLVSRCLAGRAEEAQDWLAIEGGTVFDGTGAVRSGVVILIQRRPDRRDRGALSGSYTGFPA